MGKTAFELPVDLPSSFFFFLSFCAAMEEMFASRNAPASRNITILSNLPLTASNSNFFFMRVWPLSGKRIARPVTTKLRAALPCSVRLLRSRSAEQVDEQPVGAGDAIGQLPEECQARVNV